MTTGWHGGAVVRMVSSQHEGYGFEPRSFCVKVFFFKWEKHLNITHCAFICLTLLTRSPFPFLPLQVAPVFLPVALFWQLSRYKVLQLQSIFFNFFLSVLWCVRRVGCIAQSTRTDLLKNKDNSSQTLSGLQPTWHTFCKSGKVLFHFLHICQQSHFY